MIAQNLTIPASDVEAFCRRWQIRELSIFGSALRDDFTPHSDVDVLISFKPDHPWSLYDLDDMQDELGVMLGRRVDLVVKEALRNPLRRERILKTRRVLYAA